MVLKFLCFIGVSAADPTILDSRCWNQATAIARSIRILKSEDNMQQPKTSDPCALFTDLDKQAMALGMGECRSAERLQSTELGCISKSIPTARSLREVESHVVRCMKQLPNFEFHIYIEQLNHIENVCFHVHSSLWQQRTSEAVDHLSSSASYIATKIDESSKKYDVMLEKQDISLVQQDKIIKSGQQLQRVIEGGQLRVQAAFDSIRSQVEEEHAKVQTLFGDIFDGVNKLASFQQFLKLKMLDLQSLGLYAFLIFISQHLTSTQRTQESKGPIFLIWTMLAFTEIFVLRILNAEDEIRIALTFAARVFATILAFACWIRCYVYYEDPSAKALKAVAHQMYALHTKVDQVISNKQRQMQQGSPTTVYSRRSQAIKDAYKY